MTQSSVHPEADESVLIDRARSGNREAMQSLLTSVEQRVYSVCHRMLRNPDDAIEVAQDTMVKAIQNLDHFEGSAKFSTWITRIAMNQAVSRMRRLRVRQAGSLDQDDSRADLRGGGLSLRHFLADAREQTPHERVESSEQIELLRLAISRLDESARSMLVLRDFEEMDYAEIAEVLEIPIGTVKSRLFRARLALRSLMETTDHPEAQNTPS